MENIEKAIVAEDVGKCVIQGLYSGNSLLCYRGLKPSDYVFIDEEEVYRVFSLIEQGKLGPSTYAVQKAMECVRQFDWNLGLK